MMAVFLALVSALALGDPLVRLSTDATSIEVGERFELVVDLEVDATEVLDDPFEFASVFVDEWVLFDVERQAPRRGREAGRAVTTWTLALAVLEPGSFELGSILVEPLGFADALEGEAPTIEVRSLLAEDATEPRPLVDFDGDWNLESSDELERGWVFWVVGASLVSLCLFSLWHVLLGRTPGETAEGEPGPAERAHTLRLDELRDSSLTGLRERVFGMTGLIRELVDQRRGTTSPGATDDEWLKDVLGESKIDAATRGELTEIFELASTIKYKGERPSDFALDGLGKRAAALIERELAHGGDAGGQA